MGNKPRNSEPDQVTRMTSITSHSPNFYKNSPRQTGHLWGGSVRFAEVPPVDLWSVFAFLKDLGLPTDLSASVDMSSLL
ncbi:hypothetical protein TNCV_2688301 [Trichonephila clavipes]|nr:hypothetical protein TNCV_2688301 [Trichonephila clavipes]